MVGTDGGIPRKNILTRRDFLKISLVSAAELILAACGLPVRTPTAPSSPGASPSPTNPNVLRPTPTTVPGETIQGETLAMGGGQLRLSSMSGAEIAKAVQGIGPDYKTLKVLVNDEGFSDSFIGFAGENQTQIALVAQGPRGFIWDSKQGIWDSPSGDLVFIPDVVLPGTFDEVKNTAGPSALADHVFLAQNNLGYLQAGVIYSPDVVASLKEKGVNIKLLADGSGRGLFMGDQKIIALLKGQSIERDINSDLIRKNADGSYQRMITSWANVKGKEQLYQVGAFAGPVETIPEVPYPGEKFTQEAANAFGIKPEEVGNLTPVVKTGADGKQFVVMTTGDLVATANFDESGTSLLIAEQGENGEWGWSVATLKKLAEKIKVDGETFGMGTTVDLGETSHTNPLYLSTASQQFNLLTVAGGFMQQYINKYDGARVYSDFAQRNGMRLRIHPLFWHQDVPDNLQSASKTEIVSYMQQRIKNILEYVKKGSNTQIVLANEAFWFANGNGGYVHTSPFFKAFGKDWIAEAYVMVHDIASSSDFNLKLGDDFTLMVNDYAIETPGPKADIVLQELQRTKQVVASRLGIDNSNVQLNLGLQFHLGQSRNQYEYRVPPSAVTQDILTDHFKRMSQVGPIDLTEVDALIDDENTKANTIKVLIQSALQSRVCQSICFWGDLAFDPNRPEQRTLFTPDFLQPTTSYNVVQKALKDFIGTNTQ